MLEFLSRHAHAVSAKQLTPGPYQFGVAHVAGQPDHGDGYNDGNDLPSTPSSVISNPSGSPGVHVFGPTVFGGVSTGLLLLAVMPVESPRIHAQNPTSQRPFGVSE